MGLRLELEFGDKAEVTLARCSATTGGQRLTKGGRATCRAGAGSHHPDELVLRGDVCANDTVPLARHHQ
ncbi:MAG: hypothetical protein DLM66_04155 [Candidatus Dormiibacter spiritus]|nr:MAG: hypothetical protein DLM66_04155 [Candidatus Dormibacteraeota bacterium]